MRISNKDKSKGGHFLVIIRYLLYVCMYVTGVHRLVEMVVTLRISAAPDGSCQIY